jgi:serine/threonine-protein kinase
MVGLERLLIGRTLGGRYAIQELIGQGRGGLVYRAHDAGRDADVAVKVLNAPRSADARERFRQLVGKEVRAAAAVHHPHVAGVYELGSDAELDLDFVAMELLRGQSLAGVLAQRGKPPMALGLRLLAEAAEALGAAHAAGLVHRDLRPASMYLVRGEAERQVRVKLAGFGMPQLVRKESLAVAAPEIRAYASPEMLAGGSARLTPASDVFSLGMIGYELITGALPLDDAARRTLAEGGQVEIALPQEVGGVVPPHVTDAVMHALRMNPADRFDGGTAFAAALRGAPQPAAAPAAVPPVVAAPAPAAESAPPAVTAAPQPVAAAPEAAAAPGPAVAPVAAAAAVAAGVVAGEAVASASAEPAAAEAGAAEPVAEAVAPAPPMDSAPGAPRAARPRAAPGKAGAPDLELYYPPQLATKPPVTPAASPTPAPAVASTAAPVASAPPPPPVEEHAPPAVEEPAAVPIAAFAVPAAVAAAAATPAAAESVAAPAAETLAESAAAAPAEEPVLTLVPGSERRKRMAGAGGFRAPPAMAAGFVLGILVLGSAAWMATRHSPKPATAPAAALASNLATGAAATPAAAAPGAAQPAATPAADSAAKTPEQQAALDAAKKKQQEDQQRKADEEKARQAALLLQQQQQQQALAQAQPQQQAAQPTPQQPAPAQARPQQVAVAPAPPPPPAPAPAPAQQEAARPTNEVYDIDVVEQRPQLQNMGELQRALQDRYPAQLYNSRISGRVTATFVVGTDGRVDPSSIRILNTPNQGFNMPTQSVLRRARFRPATVKGQPVRVQVTMPVTWNLDQ